MTPLQQVYSIKNGTPETANKVIATLEQNGIDVYTFCTPGEVPQIFVMPEYQDEAEILLHDIYFPPKEKLPGEFICLEVQGDNGELKGLNIFYDGILQHTWHPVK